MRTTHLAAVALFSAAFGAAACHVDEPVTEVTSASCGPQWRTSVDMQDRFSDLGASVADDGAVVLAAFQDRGRNIGDEHPDPDVAAFELFDAATGDVLVERTVLNQPPVVWGVQAVAVQDGFLVFTFLGGFAGDPGGGVRVQRVDESGAVTNDITLPVTGGNTDDRVVADDDGATLISFGMDVSRLDAAGNLVSLVHVEDEDDDGADWCTGVARDDDTGRLVAWCTAWDAQEAQWDHVSVVSMDVDGENARAVRVGSIDGGGDAVDGNGVPVTTTRLAAIGGGRFAATMEDGARVLAVVVDAGGALLVPPVEIASVDGNDQLLGGTVCTGTCAGLWVTAGAEDGAVVVSYEVDDLESFFPSERVELVRLTVETDADTGALSLVPCASGEEDWAHAHTTATTASSGAALMSWVDDSGIHIPWDLPPQKLFVEKSCALP